MYKLTKMNLNNIKKILSILFTGIIMGIVETIPGISGSTIAIVSGIYEKIIKSINSFDLKLVNLLKKRNFKESWKYINGSFLLKVLLGMIIGIVTSIFTITALLKTHPTELWSFFFGLILTSGFYLGYKNFFHTKNKNNIKKIKQTKENIKNTNFISNADLFSTKTEHQNNFIKNSNKINQNNNIKIKIINFAFFALGLFLTILLIHLVPATGSSSLPIIFLSGVASIIAFILPGISGSFVLLLLGMYSIIIPSIKDFLTTFNFNSFLISITFAFGMFFGILIFSKILNYLLTKWKDNLMAFLIGIIFGSLFKIWPWKITDKIILDNGTIVNVSNNSFNNYPNYKILTESNYIPQLNIETIQMIILMFIGSLSILLFIFITKTKK